MGIYELYNHFFNAKIILKNTKDARNDKILKERENCFFKVSKGLNKLEYQQAWYLYPLEN